MDYFQSPIRFFSETPIIDPIFRAQIESDPQRVALDLLDPIKEKALAAFSRMDSPIEFVKMAMRIEKPYFELLYILEKSGHNFYETTPVLALSLENTFYERRISECVEAFDIIGNSTNRLVELERAMLNRKDIAAFANKAKVHMLDEQTILRIEELSAILLEN